MGEALEYLLELKKLYGGDKHENLRTKCTNSSKQTRLG